MKTKFTFLLIFCISFLSAQSRIFDHTINENSLTDQQKISTTLASNYILTKYYSQSSFDLKSDLQIILPNNKQINAKYSKSFSYSNKSESSSYVIENEPNSELVFSKYDNMITGMYASGNGEKIIFHANGQRYIFAVSVVNEGSLLNQDSKNDFILSESSISQKVNSNVCLDTTPVCSATTIDVLVVYTSAARTVWGGCRTK